MKKALLIFFRDLKVNSRDFIGLYILMFPVLFAIVILLFTPGISDTSVSLAILDSQTESYEYYQDFARVEMFSDIEAIEERVLRRDHVIGIIEENGESYLLAQGNESDMVVDYAKLLNTLYIEGASLEDTNASIVEFGKTVPPLKKLLVNIGILFTTVLGGMLITMNIVEEKVDNTVSAINVTPVSRMSFIFGKGLMGVMAPIVGSFAILLITGFWEVNIGQILVMVFVTSLISLVLGFIEGLINDDFMSAAGTMKMLFLPLGGSIAAVELLSEGWQRLFYWIPFYWAYRGNVAVLNGTATWGEILFYAGIVLVITSVLFILIAPRIRKGLEQ